MKSYTLNLLRYLLKRNSRIAGLLLVLIYVFSFGRWKYKVVNCDWLDRYDADVIGVLRETSDGGAYAPSFFGENKTTSLNVHFPELQYRLFRNTSISVSSSSLLIGGDSLAIERVGRYDSESFDYSGGHILMHEGNHAIVKIKKNIYIECGVFLGGNGSFNYYHWLMELIPKCEFFHRIPYKKFPLLVSSDVDELISFKEILDKFAPNVDVVTLQKDKIYSVGDLVYIDTPNNLPFNLRPGNKMRASYTLIHPQSIKYIRNICLSDDVINDSSQSTYPKKIFLKRKIERRKYNQDSVENILQKHGFVSVCMEELSFEEQVRTMFHCEWIVGPTGAAWTNLIFCQKGAKALCWMAEELGEFSAFSTIAGNVGVDLEYITYHSGIHTPSDAYYRDYHIDVDLIERIVSSS